MNRFLLKKLTVGPCKEGRSGARWFWDAAVSGEKKEEKKEEEKEEKKRFLAFGSRSLEENGVPANAPVPSAIWQWLKITELGLCRF